MAVSRTRFCIINSEFAGELHRISGGFNTDERREIKAFSLTSSIEEAIGESESPTQGRPNDMIFSHFSKRQR